MVIDVWKNRRSVRCEVILDLFLVGESKYSRLSVCHCLSHFSRETIGSDGKIDNVLQGNEQWKEYFTQNDLIPYFTEMLASIGDQKPRDPFQSVKRCN